VLIVEREFTQVPGIQEDDLPLAIPRRIRNARHGADQIAGEDNVDVKMHVT